MGHPGLDFNRSASEYTAMDEPSDEEACHFGGGPAGTTDANSFSMPIFQDDDETQQLTRVIQESLFTARDSIAPAKPKSRARTVSLKDIVAPLLSTTPLPSQSFQPVPQSGITASVKEQTLGGEFAHLYPFVTRVFDADQDAFAMVKWHLCNSQNIWNLGQHDVSERRFTCLQ
jgi:hypothetical protein